MITKRFRRFCCFVAVVSLVTLPSVLNQPGPVNASPMEPTCCNSPIHACPRLPVTFQRVSAGAIVRSTRSAASFTPGCPTVTVPGKPSSLFATKL